MPKILIIFGTRPEVIKMAPIMRALQAQPSQEVLTCATAQHRHLLDQVLSEFKIKPDFDLDLMTERQDLAQVTATCLGRLQKVYDSVQPDHVIVQGDTTTAFVSSLAAFYRKIPVAHVEAGLRTFDRYSPFPEEMFRRMISPMASLHFAPTSLAKKNLLKENIDPSTIYEVGNTSIDSVLWAIRKGPSTDVLKTLPKGKKIILMTAHRRENFGKPLEGIMKGVVQFARAHSDFHIAYPVHPNPNVAEVANAWLSKIPNVSLLPPLGYRDMVTVLQACHLVLTDSGGLQEEAPVLGKPVLILRETTERPEAIETGCARLIGNQTKKILSELERLIDTRSKNYKLMSNGKNPFGDGRAADKIAKVLEKQCQPLNQKAA